MNSLQDALRIFVTAAEARNFRDAATRLSLSPQAVTRAIRRLEDHFGEALFLRTTRQTRITEFGRAKAAEAVASLAQLDEVLRPAERRAAAELAGRVRVTAPRVLGRLLVLPLLTRLAVTHPAIVIDIRLSDELSDAVDERIDIGVRMGVLSQARAVMRRVGKVAFGVYASPALIARVGAPPSVDALNDLPTSALINRNTNRPWHWFFARERTLLPQQAAFITDDPAAECEAALAGIAFAQLPDYLARAHARAGRLVEVLDKDVPPPWDLMVYRPQPGPVPARVRVVFDALVNGLKENGAAGE
ncbi:LysR family transcriptional regulator [Methyloversatilis thermotolerans]|uniref:LysR family transcriptional regulator n=1 Tax=Methyloversatilis thermotolerans TaxID=1346290 RepID=UPI000362D9AF|nr:LysR family transcriptional regulator [Methyloversatilis thermotolerans]